MLSTASWYHTKTKNVGIGGH